MGWVIGVLFGLKLERGIVSCLVSPRKNVDCDERITRMSFKLQSHSILTLNLASFRELYGYSVAHRIFVKLVGAVVS